MSIKKIIYGNEARIKLKAGVDALAKAVSTTLGPKGGNVALDKNWGTPSVVHDGVTVAKEIELEDKFENMGVQIAKEAATRTNDVAGDGTTTAIVLTQALVGEGIKNISAGSSSMNVRRGLDLGCKALSEELVKNAVKISSKEERVQVATISAQSEAIGEMIAEAMEKVGNEGVITVEESKGFELELEYKEGMQFDKGYASPYFVTNQEKMDAVVENPYILLTDMKITSLQSLVPLLEDLVKVSKDLVIIADDVEGEALATLVVNKLRSVLNILAIKAPGFGDRRKAMLEDIAALTGATLISEEMGRKLDTAKVEDLGRADRVISDKDNTTIVGGKGHASEIEKRIKQLASQVAASTTDFDKERLQERLAKLSGGVAVVKVGAATEAELKELKLRVEDAVNATKAAVEEGIIPGGGITLLKSREILKSMQVSGEEKVGVDILYKACQHPFNTLITNSGLVPGEVLGELRAHKGKNIGFDVVSMKFVDLVEKGIIDPVKVVRSALQNAVSAATMILTTECLVAELPKKELKTETEFGE